MRLLMFQARRFWWKSFSKTLESAENIEAEDAVEDAVVVFMHVEAKDAAARDDVFRKTLKNIKWLANKRGFTRVVLHSFTHLGGENADPQFAGPFTPALHLRLCRCKCRRAGRTAARHRVRVLHHPLRLLQRMGAAGKYTMYKRLRREPGEGVEAGVALPIYRLINFRSGSTSKSRDAGPSAASR